MDWTLQDLKGKCLVLATLCFAAACAIHTAQIIKRRNRNRYVLAATSGFDGHMQWEFFDSRDATELAYDKVHGADIKVLLDIRNGEGPARGVLRRSGEKRAVERTLAKLRNELQSSASLPRESQARCMVGCFSPSTEAL